MARTCSWGLGRGKLWWERGRSLAVGCLRQPCRGHSGARPPPWPLIWVAPVAVSWGWRCRCRVS
eukprot:4199101-Pyramimonas_sp.AAC.1